MSIIKDFPDHIDDSLLRKDLGVFYTPAPYAKKTAELVQKAVSRVPDGNDYIILDRCAGTGNLEMALVGLRDKNGDELIRHCVVSTYGYDEYIVLKNRLGKMVRKIISENEHTASDKGGMIASADALSREYIDNPVLKGYIEDPLCTIILCENSPYRDQSQKNSCKDVDVVRTDKGYVRDRMHEEGKYGRAVNDVFNLFVYSAWKYYIRQETDSFIIIGPVKHWKRLGLSDRECFGGYVFNRLHFGATPEAVACMYFGGNKQRDSSVLLDVYDIKGDDAVFASSVTAKKTRKPMRELFDKRKDPDDELNAVCCNRDGTEAFRKCRINPRYNDNIIGYVRADAYGFDANSVGLVRTAMYNGNGFYLRKDRYLEGLPLFVAKLYPFGSWFLEGLVDTSSDGGHKYIKDMQFLKSCLIYTCLSNQNKCLSFDGSDGRRYQNELCFDDSMLADVMFDDKGIPMPILLSETEKLPLALRNLYTFAKNKMTALDTEENALLSMWQRTLSLAQKRPGYNPQFLYGVYQIKKELNTFSFVDTKAGKNRVYECPELNESLKNLRKSVRKYYRSHIAEKMFLYGLIK